MRRGPERADAIPDFMRITAHAWVVVGLFIYAAFICSSSSGRGAGGHITLDGMLVIVWQSMFWQDSLANYFTLGELQHRPSQLGRLEQPCARWFSPTET